MIPLLTGLVTFACSCAATLAGMALHARLPDDHLDSDSKDVVKLVMGLIGTMAALVLGLLVASAQSSYNSQHSNLQQLAADIAQLDHVLTTDQRQTTPATCSTRLSPRPMIVSGLRTEYKQRSSIQAICGPRPIDSTRLFRV